MGFYEFFRDEQSSPEYDWFENNCSYPAHFHNCMEIITNLWGGCDITIQGVTNHLEPFDVLLIHPGYTHLIEDYGRSICLMLSSRYMQKYLDYTAKIQPAYDCVIRGDRNLSESIIKFRERTDDENELCLKGYANYILGKCIKRMKFLPIVKSENSDLVQQIVSYLLEHFHEKITLDSLAEGLSYNKFYISEVINKNLKCNLKEYINRIRLEYFLSNYDNTRTIEEQLYSSGFHSKQTFYRVYKKAYGSTPLFTEKRR